MTLTRAQTYLRIVHEYIRSSITTSNFLLLYLAGHIIQSCFKSHVYIKDFSR